MKINFMDLKSQFGQMDQQIRERINAVLDHGRYIMGPEVTELQTELAAFTGTKHVIGCSSGTDALVMPLLALGVGPGDAVFTTPFTFIATAEVIALLGATPVFVDIDPKTFNIDPGLLAEAVTRVKQEGKLKPKGIIPVDLFGLLADYDAIEAIAREHDLFVLEDAAQSMGAEHKGRMACSFGDVAGTSFYPAKPLGAYGDGGAIFTNSDEMAERLHSIRVHGQGSDKYDNVRLGLNGRLDTMQAAVLLVKLSQFRDELAARRKVASVYNERLKGVETPHIPEGYKSAWALYSVLSDRRDDLITHLKERDVPTVIYYRTSLHQQTVFKNLGYNDGDFPVSESVQSRIVSLPMHPFLTDEQLDHIVEAVNSFSA